MSYQEAVAAAFRPVENALGEALGRRDTRLRPPQCGFGSVQSTFLLIARDLTR